MPFPLVYVEWEDSQGCTPAWIALEEFTSVIPTMQSIGWKVFESDELISICGNIALETISTPFQGNGIMTIPKRCIKSIKEIDSQSIFNSTLSNI